MNQELKEIIYEYMPAIDSALAEEAVPIHERFSRAAVIFVDVAASEASLKTKKELLKSKAFFDEMLPIFNEWYWEKYGALINFPNTDRTYSGILTLYSQPVLIKIPATTSKVEEEGETAWFKWPDHLQEFESLEEMIHPQLRFERIEEAELARLQQEASEIVSLTRSINIDLMMTSGLNADASNMAKGIWSHFEKAINDILSQRLERTSIACWDIHLAIEKALKVLISHKCATKAFGHSLNDLCDHLRDTVPNIKYPLILDLPTEKDAIRLRYAELIRSPTDALGYYRNGLRLLASIVINLPNEFGIKNASFLIKRSPWAR